MSAPEAPEAKPVPTTAGNFAALAPLLASGRPTAHTALAPLCELALSAI